ncbi:MAG: DUF445 family protein [Syntrophomonadaceae bacterium]|nr:DUF445 family protein [Syntrophomonadaceae bacterium]
MVQILVIPVISALIGYITNVVAIRLLFWPRQPVNLGFFYLQGLLPKRQADLAKSIGELVEEQLLSVNELIDMYNTPEFHTQITYKISSVLRERLIVLIPSIIPSKITNLILDNLDKILRQEMPSLINQVIESSRDYITNEVKVSTIVEDKINAFDLAELEEMIKGVSSTELRFIELLGGILGFIIGLVQLGFLYLFPM